MSCCIALLLYGTWDDVKSYQGVSIWPQQGRNNQNSAPSAFRVTKRSLEREPTARGNICWAGGSRSSRWGFWTVSEFFSLRLERISVLIITDTKTRGKVVDAGRP